MEVEQIEQISVEDSIKAAMDEVENKEEVIEEVESPRERDQTGKFKKKEEEPQEEPKEEVTAPTEKVESAPQSWGANVKAKWNELPPEVRAEINKRESDIHQKFTRHDGELNLGRKMKDVVTPYMPMIQAEGGTPETAVQSLLNTAYQLRTGTPEQKAGLLRELAHTYNIDIGMAYQSQPQIDPALKQVMDKLQGLEQKFTSQTSLQERQEEANMMAEVQAFAAKPESTYFEQVKAAMAPLLGSGQAKDLQEAYDMACWANPEIRSTLLKAQTEEALEKRKLEVTKKKQAAASITGSPGPKVASTKQSKSIEEELADAYDDIMGSRV